MDNSKLHILIMTSPITFNSQKCETYLLNLIYGGLDKIKFFEKNICIDFIFWQTLNDDVIKERYTTIDDEMFSPVISELYPNDVIFDYSYSKEKISKIIEKYSNTSYGFLNSNYNINSYFADELIENLPYGYSSGIQFNITEKYMEKIGDNDSFVFISDNCFFPLKDTLFEIYKKYKSLNIPFYTHSPFTESMDLYKESHMHIYFYDKKEIKPFLKKIRKKIGNDLFSLSFNANNYISNENLDFIETANTNQYSLDFFIQQNKLKVPMAEPGVLFSNIFWCYLIMYGYSEFNLESFSHLNHNVPLCIVAPSKKIGYGTEHLNEYSFIRKDYKSIDDVRTKLFQRLFDLNEMSYSKSFLSIQRHIFLFDSLLYNSLQSAIQFNKEGIEEFPKYYSGSYHKKPMEVYMDSINIIEDILDKINSDE